MTTAGVRAGIVKELRALFVPWLLILSAVIMAGLADGALLAPITVIGVVSLGAWSIGHEYTHRTLPLLLSQPVVRGEVLAGKLLGLFVSLSLSMLMGFAASGAVILGVTQPNVGGGALAGLVIGLTLALLHLAFVPITGNTPASLSPSAPQRRER